MGQFRFLFTAADYDEAVGFYRDTLGLDVVRSWDDHGRGTILAASGTGQIEIFEGPSPTNLGEIQLAWEVDDIDSTHERLIESGVACDVAPTEFPWGHRSASYRAPQGLTITLFTVTGEEA